MLNLSLQKTAAVAAEDPRAGETATLPEAANEPHRSVSRSVRTVSSRVPILRSGPHLKRKIAVRASTAA